MVKSIRRKSIILLSDFLLSLFAFWFARYFGDLPKWYWLVLSAVIWVAIGIFGKLEFRSYKRTKHAFLGIFALDILSGLFLYFFYRSYVPGYEYDYSILLAVGIIILLEWGLYYAIRRFVYVKIPYFYEEPSLDCVTEKGIGSGARVNGEVKDKDIAILLDIIVQKSNNKEVIRWVQTNETHFSKQTILIDSPDPESVLAHKTKNPGLIIHTFPLNGIRQLNTFFAFSNYCLDDGGYIACYCETSAAKEEKILRHNPFGVNYILFFLDYCWNRVLPKLRISRNFYFAITKGKSRTLTRVEVLGRLYRAGFDVVDEEIRHGIFYVIATKIKEPVRNDVPSTGVLIRLRRVGKGGKTIGVYKFRTMFSYSEYLQPYVYKQNSLCNGGKIADDYRVNPIGKFLRSTWLDELPMLINWAKGDLKLVGVRPLSNHYFSLYSKELQELRIKTKPGLLPPFYADMPETLEEIQESEMRYLKAYLENPVGTDWRYFWKAVGNIVVRGKRSK